MKKRQISQWPFIVLISFFLQKIDNLFKLIGAQYHNWTITQIGILANLAEYTEIVQK